MPVEVQMIQQAYKFALDPTQAQAAALASHAGARRYAFNWAHAMISAAADARQAQKDAGLEPDITIPGQFEIGPQWTRWRDTATGCRRCRALLTPGTIAAADLRRGHLIQAGAGYVPIAAVTAHDGEITVVYTPEACQRSIDRWIKNQAWA